MSPKFMPDFNALQASLDSERETAFESKRKELELLSSIDDSLQSIAHSLNLLSLNFDRFSEVVSSCCEDGSIVHVAVEEFHE